MTDHNSPSTPKYCWLDLETTGLDPKIDVILEVAAIITDANLVEIGEPFQSLVWNGIGRQEPGPRHIELLKGNAYVSKMHTNNGLLSELDALSWPAPAPERVRTSPEVVEERLIDFIRLDDVKLVLAGSTIGFDRSFLKVHMPEFEKQLHYRQRDVSSDKMMFEDAIGLKFKKAEAHRALADVRESLGHVRELQNMLRRFSKAARNEWEWTVGL